MAGPLCSLHLISQAKSHPSALQPPAPHDPQSLHKANIPRFLNRLLGLSIPEQQVVFDYFSSLLDVVIQGAKSKGSYGG